MLFLKCLYCLVFYIASAIYLNPFILSQLQTLFFYPSPTHFISLVSGFCDGPYWRHCSVQFSSVHSVVSDSLWPHEPQHARPPCPSLTPGVHPNPCPLSWWCHPTISSSVVPLLLLPSIFPSIRVFFNESALRIRWPKYWSFSFNISPSKEHPGLISFRI